jgi:hypothetical protein
MVIICSVAAPSNVVRVKRGVCRIVSHLAAILFLAMASTASLWIAFAQEPDAPAFEVTSIKPSQPDTAGPLIGISPGRLTLTP